MYVCASRYVGSMQVCVCVWRLVPPAKGKDLFFGDGGIWGRRRFGLRLSVEGLDHRQRLLHHPHLDFPIYILKPARRESLPERERERERARESERERRRERESESEREIKRERERERDRRGGRERKRERN